MMERGKHHSNNHQRMVKCTGQSYDEKQGYSRNLSVLPSGTLTSDKGKSSKMKI